MGQVLEATRQGESVREGALGRAGWGTRCQAWPRPRECVPSQQPSTACPVSRWPSNSVWQVGSSWPSFMPLTGDPQLLTPSSPQLPGPWAHPLAWELQEEAWLFEQLKGMKMDEQWPASPGEGVCGWVGCELPILVLSSRRGLRGCWLLQTLTGPRESRSHPISTVETPQIKPYTTSLPSGLYK